MQFRTQVAPTDDEIRLRSYLIWERKGRPEGNAEEHWSSALAELEREFNSECIASLQGKSTTYVVPLLQISKPPTIVETAEIEPVTQFSEKNAAE